jgi:hypothetical protein
LIGENAQPPIIEMAPSHAAKTVRALKLSEVNVIANKYPALMAQCYATSDIILTMRNSKTHKRLRLHTPKMAMSLAAS